MIVLPFREQMILLITFIVIFLVFWVDDKRLKNKNHILNKIFYYLPSFNSNQRTGFMLLTVAAVCAVLGVALYLSIIVLVAGLSFIYKGRN
uniref:MedDCM-OCT-S40-C92-cds30 n=1 Tax=Candidatus Actinomarina minuta TaxID=1389454 RepID=S5DXS7_9ACTN|nr:MedDCM-OCT-S40-C92-cds30 [Candidatus Actinomarina minuta]